MSFFMSIKKPKRTRHSTVKKSGKLIVAAIDFGTTYSGYAYSFKDTYNRDPLKIYSHLWTDGTGIHSTKVPTTVLFDTAGEFNSFGYEAEEKYIKLTESNKHEGWKYFRHFKMTLHDKPKLTLKHRLRDDQGKTMPAIQIFTAAIRYLKDHLIEKLIESNNVAKQPDDRHQSDDPFVIQSDILWVLTVPAIWSDSAKQFMRVAAVQAGILESHLILALEPEAAAIFSKTAVFSRNKSDETDAFSEHSKLMVVDLGGGTVDITVHKVQTDGKLHELYPPSGGPWGGTLVDEKILELVENIFGTKVLEILQNECKTETLDMYRSLELKKRQFKMIEAEDVKVSLTMPSSLFKIYEDKNPSEIFSDRLNRLYPKQIEQKWGRLIIDQKLFLKVFAQSIDSISAHLETLCKRQDMRDVNTLVLVGGYSECDVLRKSIKKTFTDKRVIIPEEASNAVVKGAVLFGFNPGVIDMRRAPCTYGISTAVPFDDQLHPAIHKHGNMCEDVFKVFIPVGAEIVPDETEVIHTFNTANSTMIELYKSISEKPSYVTDPGCESIGVVDISGAADESSVVDIVMKFGDTELRVEAKEKESGKKVTAKFNFLN